MRELSKGMSGTDVRKYKDILFKLGYLRASTHNRFGDETAAAVKDFQAKHGLKVDGIIGSKTGPALDAAYKQYLANPELPPKQDIVQYLKPGDYPNISLQALAEINLDLQDESAERIAFVREVMRWVYPYALYVFGANLYEPNRTAPAPTVAYIEARADKSPDYYDGGRESMMKTHIRNCEAKGQRLGRTDCSGLPVGVARFMRLVSPTFDSTAHNLYHGHCKGIKKADLRPGDLAFARQLSGHIPHVGVYVGAGYMVDASGGAYTVGISKIDKHVLVNRVTGKTEQRQRWVVFGRPKYFAA